MARSVDLPALAGLFRVCFGTDEAYEHLFFSQRFRPEDTVVLRCGGEVAAMVYRLPLTFLLDGREMKGRYLYAVGTHPNHRGKGYSTALLEECHRLARQEGTALSLLVPAEPSLFSFYDRRGFTVCSCRRHLTVHAAPEEIPFQVGDLADCAPLRDGYFSRGGLYGRWDAAALSYAQRENAQQGGWTLTFPGGYLVAHPEGEGMAVLEIVPGEMPSAQVAAAAAAHLGRSWARLSLWPAESVEGNLAPFAMAAFYEPLGKGVDCSHSYFGLPLD